MERRSVGRLFRIDVKRALNSTPAVYGSPSSSLRRITSFPEVCHSRMLLTVARPGLATLSTSKWNPGDARGGPPVETLGNN